jgi:RNA polymerase sigma-70 factor (ECF subfamily)
MKGPMDWRSLSEKYGDRVFLIARSILRDDALALDVSQEALLKVGQALNGSAKVQDYESWVLTIAGNAARDALRKQTRRREVPIEDTVADPRTPDEALLAGESVERLRLTLEALPAAARDVLLLKFREGLSGPQIAQALGVSITAAWQQVSRALKLLKLQLAEKP